MDKFVLKLSPSATRDLDRLDEKAVRKILEALPKIEEDPFPRGKQVKKIKGEKSTFYRLRVGKHRVFYLIEGREVAILKIVSKKDTDRFIKNI